MIKDIIKRQNEIDKNFYTDKPLGVIYKNGISTFNFWSPTAKKVILSIFDKNNSDMLISTHELSKDEKGIWSFIEKNRDLDGFFYQYTVDNRVVFDPYAKSIASFRVSPKGEALSKDKVAKGAIINLEKTLQLQPFFKDNFLSKEDAIIYEVHIRDFTSEEGMETKNTKGSYNAFIEKLNYIKELGVTHIQLLPIMKFFYNDEENKEMEYHWSSKGNNYNWGYDPYSYFTPEGVYASNSKDPYNRINELKNLISEIHKKGLGVILDVVYTHMADRTLLDNIVEKYFFFFKENGEYAGGFGNNLATTQKMAKKLLLDSVRYWFEEYKIDGMRFDMMGDADSETIEEAYQIAKSINPQTIFIGEGWRTFQGQAYDAKGADQDWAKESSSVGMFSDDFRNILKSGFMQEGAPRFLTNGKVSIKILFENIKAKPSNFTPSAPGSVVQYIEAHDNATLHDIIAIALDVDPTKNQEEIQKRIRLGNFMVLTSQGISFIHAGQEYGRTKEWHGEKDPEQKFIKNSTSTFIDDSYDSTDFINSFSWKKLATPLAQKTFNFTKEMIKLRKSLDIFRYKTFEEIEKNMELLSDENSIDLFLVYRNKNYIFFINADLKEREFNIDLKNFKVIVDGDSVDISGIKNYKYISIENKNIKIAPLSAILIEKE